MPTPDEVARGDTPGREPASGCLGILLFGLVWSVGFVLWIVG